MKKHVPESLFLIKLQASGFFYRTPVVAASVPSFSESLLALNQSQTFTSSELTTQNNFFMS